MPVKKPWRWQAHNVSTKEKRSGEESSRMIAEQAAEKARTEIGPRHVVTYMFSPTGIEFHLDPAERRSGLVWRRAA